MDVDTVTYTIGALAREFGLSRSTLLYYDSIGLLRPASRSRSNYRLYDECDRGRLANICRYRKTGLGLEQIGEILDGSSSRTAAVLEERLGALNDEIGRLRDQQRFIVRLLSNRSALQRSRSLDKRSWVALLRKSGMSDDDMRGWHVEFERMAPEAHQDFLESLGIPTAEIRSIRRWAAGERRGSASAKQPSEQR